MNVTKMLKNFWLNIKFNSSPHVSKQFSICTQLCIQQLHSDFNWEKAESSLWFTNLPNNRKRAVKLANKKKMKIKSKPMPSGALIIDCKNKNLNHYKGIHYGKFDVVPLASKGWHHKKSVGDYFTILPLSEHPAFLLSSNERISLSFEEIGLSSKVIEQLQKIGINCPTVIQAKALPKLLTGENVLVAAETGCGKTLTYLIPMVENILKWKNEQSKLYNSPFGIIILPTRELAIQVGNVVQQLCSDLGISCLTLLGGHTKQLLLNPVMQPVDILVCSLGVLSKSLTHRLYDTSLCKHIVLDEADTLLDDSFIEVLQNVFKKLKLSFTEPSMRDSFSNSAQLCLVSATMPRNVDSILEPIISTEILNIISSSYLHKVLPHIPQLFRRIKKSQKAETLLEVVKKNINEKLPTLIFSNKTDTCNWLNLFLNESGVKSIRINGKMNFEERLKQYQEFRDGIANVVSCTDVASRGLDCTRAKCVINYDFPKFMADYVHRSGRIGRIGHVNGCSVTNFVASRAELKLVHEIEKAVRLECELHNVNNNITRIIKHKILKVV